MDRTKKENFWGYAFNFFFYESYKFTVVCNHKCFGYLSTTQVSAYVHEIGLDEKKKNLFNEVINILGLTRIEAIMAAMKLASDTSGLSIFYQCSNDEWKKDFVLNLINPDLPLSFTL